MTSFADRELVLADTEKERLRFGDDLRKLSAFLRRDFLIAWSYRTAFLGDLAGLGLALLSFYFVGLMVDPAVLPSYGGERSTYMEFVAIGLVFGAFVGIGLSRIGAALRAEQLMGTLESVLMTPTAPTTIQLGSVVYEVISVPIRTLLFLGVIALAFGIDFELGGIAPAAALLLAFFPFIWGLGVLSAGATLVFRRAGSGIGLAIGAMTLFSGAYFPVGLLPGWLAATAAYNPIGIALEGMREALLGGAGFDQIASDILVLLPFSIGAMLLGVTVFAWALRRERRTGTLGLY